MRIRNLALVPFLAILLLGMAPVPARAAQTAAVQAHLLWAGVGAEDVETQLDKAKAAGAGMLRVDVGWASIEQEGKGNYNSWYLGRMDHVVREAEARGIKLLFTFWETPCWASTAPEELKQGCKGAWWNRDVQRYPPASAADYADALAFAVRRYGSRVAAWEIWNEPNHNVYFKASDKVASYARLVKAAYGPAKQAHPGTTILAGSLADADFEFTEALYAAGVKGSFDAWSVHPYSEDRSPLDPGIAGWTKKSFARGVPAVRETMLRHGDDKPLWLTELGWSTCSVRGQAAYDNCVDQGRQAEYLRLAFEQMRAWRYVPVGVWFNLQDTSSDAGDRVDNYGLLRHDGSAKPALDAFRGVAATAGSAGPPASLILKCAASSCRRGSRLKIRVFRRAGRIYVSGRFPTGRKARVRAYTWKRRSRRFSGRASYRSPVRVSHRGVFRHRVRKGALRRGRWLIEVRGFGAATVSAKTRLRRPA